MTESRNEEGNWIDSLLKDCTEAGILPRGRPSVVALQGDASDRKFFRIRAGSRHYIGLISPRRNLSGLDENDSYFLIGKHLARCNLPVPEFLWSDLEKGQFLLQDLGDYHLQRHARRGAINLQALYRRVVRLLVKVHRFAPEGFGADFCFDTSIYSPSFVYERELEYFRESFFNNYLDLDVAEEDLRGDFESLAEAAGTGETRHVMHRDFQSRNIMVSQGRLWILDFQGMRHGPPAYDLAALLLDPYVMIPKPLQRALVEYYWAGARDFLGCSQRAFRSSYEAVKLCRNLQVLAAYGFLGAVKGKRQFLQYIPRAWEQLMELLGGALKGRYPRLENYVAEVRRWHRIG